MPAFDPRTPVLVGCGQLSNRVDQGAEPLEPVDLMAEALRRAEDDAGVSGLLVGADSIRVICLLSWRYLDPAALLGERIGAGARETAYTAVGGNYPQTVVNRTAVDILEGRNDLVLVAGAEAWRTNRRFRDSDERPPWTRQPDATAPSVLYGSDDPEMMHPAELARGIAAPIQLYPMFENALRAALGLSVEEHLARISGLWSRFSEVAATNPHAWIQTAYTPRRSRPRRPGTASSAGRTRSG